MTKIDSKEGTLLTFGRHHSDSKGQSSSVETEESRRFDSALFATLDALEQKRIDYAVIGGVAAFAHGRPRATQDIDIFVRPEDADNLLELLKQNGFDTNRYDPTWLFKAYKEDVLIDVIFRSQGNIYYDEEMSKHTVVLQYHGRPIRVVSPEDFVLIKCAAHSEEGYHHWHDALAVLSQAKLDWDYLIHRARKAPRRLLALLIYAQSADIWIPNSHIEKLFTSIFEDRTTTKPTPQVQARQERQDKLDSTYLAARIKDALIKSESTGALDIDVFVQENKVMVRGQTHTEEQSKAILDIIKKLAPARIVESQLHVANWSAPDSIEVVQ